jgi:hypothetical protein
MMRTNTFRVLAIFSVLVGAPLAATGHGATDVAGPPQIAECRVGFGGYFKVGCWSPIWVAVSGDVAGRPLRVEATTSDSDGVRVSVTASVATAGDSAQGLWRVPLYARIGRIAAALNLKLVAEDGSVVDRRELSPRTDRETAGAFVPLPATGDLFVHLGATDVGLGAAYEAPEPEDWGGRRALARVLDVDALPAEWYGYDAVDVLVLTTSDAALVRRLAADRRRFAALRRWLELGGRMVILCGGEETSELLGEGGPLADLVPGRFAEMVRLSETGSLEFFARSNLPIGRGDARATILVPQIVGVEGAVEAYAGRRPNDLPLVVRTARGLGEVAFVGVDLAADPLKEWPGRKAFLQAVLRPYVGTRRESKAAQSLVARGYNDLSGALRQRLGRSFAGVAPITFSVVTILAVAYLLVLGPVDYLLVHRWLRRPWMAWVTFPLIVLVFGLGSWAVATWRQSGGGARVNGLELVDIDTLTGQARGTFWAALYSPRAEQLDVALDVRWPDGSRRPDAEVLLSWWGLPGVGVGGMQAGAMEVGIIEAGYEYGADLGSLIGVPVLTSSTKSLLARWRSPAPAAIEAQLFDRDGLVEGFIENRSGGPLRNLRLLYNGWAYRLGDLDAGARIEVGDAISPRRVKTVVTQDALGAPPSGEAGGDSFVAQRAAAEQVVRLMMFYEAAGGMDFAQLANEYQAYCDLSRLLELGRAILVADAPTGGSRLVAAGNGSAIDGDEGRTAAVYRFVLAVARGENDG